MGPGVVRVTAYAFHYAAECETCGNSVDISHADLRRGFSGYLQDKARMEQSLICACGAARADERPKLLRSLVEARKITVTSRRHQPSGRLPGNRPTPRTGPVIQGSPALG